MNDKALLKTGVIGAVILALCCFTPLLVVLVAVGLSAITGYLDYVLLPALLFFVGLTSYAVWRRAHKLKAAEKLEKHG